HQDTETVLPFKLLVLVDSSESMNFTDEFNNLSRWDAARRLLSTSTVTATLKRLALEQKMEVIYYQGAESVSRFDPEGKATGKRTDVGAWLHELGKTHGRDKDLRGLLLFSDGADNGTRFFAEKEAPLWSGVCPIHTFALGNP